MAENYTLESDVDLPLDVKKKVKEIADAYHTATQKKLVVTSGARTSQSQAEAMYTKMAGGDALAVYANQSAAQKIRSIYDEGVKANTSKSALIEEIKSEIDSQISQGIYISKHLKQGAVDIRSRDMSNDEKKQLKEAAKNVASTVILETIPPHFHLQF